MKHVFEWLFAAVLISAASQAVAQNSLGSFLADKSPAELFPGADRIGRLQGDPPVAAAYAGEKKLGYLFLNSDFVDATGYSGKPIRILIDIDLNAVIVSAQIVEHHEPIVLAGIPEQRILDALNKYTGVDLAALETGASQQSKVDVISGATVTSMVIDDTIIHAARSVSRRLGLGGLEAEGEIEQADGERASVDMQDRSIRSWQSLVDQGAVRRLRVTVEDVNTAFTQSGDTVAASRPESGDAADIFIELYAAMVSVPSIGLSLLGEGEYENLQKRLAPGQQAILLSGRGRYSFKGSGYVRGGIFDRFQIKQGDTSIRFHDYNYKRVRRIEGDGAPDFSENDIFVIPEDMQFDAASPWRLELLVGRATGPTSKAFVTFELPYELPQAFLKQPVAPVARARPAAGTKTPERPLWLILWKQKIWQVGVLSISLLLLTAIFFFQDWLVRRPKLTHRIRTGFLIFTLFGIGWYANAQLSVVNILTVFNALTSGFSWSYFLMEPLIFILWGAVAASLLFWGRGAFCGWLCPFGAMQELLNKIAKGLRIPQIKVPWWLHERLWALKYIIFLVLFGVSLHSLNWAERLAEVEPFKTAIVLKFSREWPYVLFAGGMLAAGLFIERFYCRYLCPLGAALAIPGKIRLFDWLKRYQGCGNPCQRCANECMVQAIHPEGNINPNECLYCLHCQEVYFDDHHCYVLVQRRLKHERRSARVPPAQSLTEAVKDMEKVAN